MNNTTLDLVGLLWHPSEELLTTIALFMIVTSLPTFIACLLVRAPYGRYHDQASWIYGFEMNGTLAWVLQECPTVVLGIVIVLFSPAPLIKTNTVNLVLYTYFMIHYIHRSFIFPFLLRGGKPTPFVLFITAFVFCAINGFLQIQTLATVNSYDETWFSDPRFLIGSFLFWSGLLINHHSDHVLRNLRKPGETGYKIPHGGAFEYVSAANYFGEIVEWLGFAIATWSLAGFAFAIFTFSAIGARGYQHHLNYLERFKDKYPKNRKAVIPFIW